jgi:hypothetical protein
MCCAVLMCCVALFFVMLFIFLLIILFCEQTRPPPLWKATILTIIPLHVSLIDLIYCFVICAVLCCDRLIYSLHIARSFDERICCAVRIFIIIYQIVVWQCGYNILPYITRQVTLNAYF